MNDHTRHYQQEIRDLVEKEDHYRDIIRRLQDREGDLKDLIEQYSHLLRTRGDIINHEYDTRKRRRTDE